MNFVRHPERSATTAVAKVHDASALGRFNDPNCAALVWQRDTPATVQDWINSVDPDRLPSGRVVLRADAVAATVRRLCEVAGMPDGVGRSWLEKDVASLAALFAALSSAPFLRLRLDVIETNACRRFHVDAVTSRLVCTYRGTGTQYGDAVAGQDPYVILTVPTGAPILLKGTLAPTTAPSRVLHRSPPIEGTGESRLVLVLDPVLDLEDEL